MASRPESEWNDEQRAWMLALAHHRASRCPGCGLDFRETTSHERDGIDFIVPPPIRCRACDTLAVAQEANERPRPQALHWHAEKKRG